jgi:alkanesulfonate monooxygenase SsuD/methylene tetrahydromethanopterin reductase-like flavin-dependent oxidoreductase (luciferase family)
MRLRLHLGYWGTVPDADNVDLALEAEGLGYSSVWAAETHGNDAPTVLAWLAANTQRIKLGSAIFQVPARTPAMTAAPIAREPLRYYGTHFGLPLPDGHCRTLKMIFHPARERLPVYLASISRRNLKPVDRKCDGWLAVFYDPQYLRRRYAAAWVVRPHRPHVPARPGRANCRRDAGTGRVGGTTLNVKCFATNQLDWLATLPTAADALDRSGTG